MKMKVKIALMKMVEYDFDIAVIAREDGGFYCGEDRIQISEAMDVDFKMIDNVDLTAKKVELIDDKISKAKAGIHLLEQSKSELLAIPDMSGERK